MSDFVCEATPAEPLAEMAEALNESCDVQVYIDGVGYMPIGDLEEFGMDPGYWCLRTSSHVFIGRWSSLRVIRIPAGPWPGGFPALSRTAARRTVRRARS